MYKADCVFCQIVKKEISAHKIWEDDKHLAILSIFPNTLGFTVVLTKEHFPSYAFENSDQVLADLVIATKKVARILDNFFKDVSRCGMFFEGFGVDHLHSKLFPMHGTEKAAGFEPIESKKMNQYFEYYPGYLCSNNSSRVDDQELADLAKKIRTSYK